MERPPQVVANAEEGVGSSSSVDAKQGFLINRINHKKRGFCLSFPGRALCISWGNDERYWTYGPKEGSRFSEVAILKYVWWLNLWKDMKVTLPPGEYTILWVLHLEDDSGESKVKFHYTIESGNEKKTEVKEVELSRSATGWVAYNGGHFMVTDFDEINLSVSMKNTEKTVKSGFWVDGVVIHSGRPDELDAV